MCRLRCNCDTVQRRVRNLLVARTKPLVTTAAITQPERRDVTSAVEWVCLRNLGTVLGSSNANDLFKYSCVRFYLQTETSPKSKQHPAASLENAVPVPPHLPFSCHNVWLLLHCFLLFCFLCLLSLALRSWVVVAVLTSRAGTLLAVGHSHPKWNVPWKRPDHPGQVKGVMGTWSCSNRVKDWQFIFII